MTPLAVDPLPKDEHLIEVDPVLQGRVDVSQLAMRREEHEGAAANPAGHGRYDLLHPAVEVVVLRSGQVGGQAHQRLVEEVKRRGQDELLGVGAQTNPRSKVVAGWIV